MNDGLLFVAGGKDASGNTLSSAIYGFATVKTDKSDYPPGTTVNITGSGWQPNETVTLTLVESPLIDTHGPYTAIADANGNISDSSFVTDSHDLNVGFTLTAVGSVSQAQATLSDSKPTKLTITSTSSAGIPLASCAGDSGFLSGEDHSHRRLPATPPINWCSRSRKGNLG